VQWLRKPDEPRNTLGNGTSTHSDLVGGDDPQDGLASLEGQAVGLNTQSKVLDALNRATGRNYSLNDLFNYCQDVQLVAIVEPNRELAARSPTLGATGLI
jgi:hypothetical protein